MAPPMYNSLPAVARILGTEQSPEGIELAAQQISSAQAGTGQGVPNPMMGQGVPNQMMQQGIPAARPTPGMADPRIQGSMGADLLLEETVLPWNLDVDTWLTQFHDKDVPWQEGLTFGEYLDKIGRDHGTEAVLLAIKEFQKVQKERTEERAPSVEPPPSTPAPQPMPPMPMPAPPPQAPAPGGQQVQQPPGQQQPIMAHGGGFVHRGTIAGELAPKGIMSAREAGETLHELRKRYQDEQNYRRYNSVGTS